jgi:hypothetical protein
MDFIKKILEYLSKKTVDQGYTIFQHLNAEGEKKIVTIHHQTDGMVLLCVFTEEEWAMVTDIHQITGDDIEGIILDLAEDHSIPTIYIDPTDMF